MDDSQVMYRIGMTLDQLERLAIERCVKHFGQARAAAKSLDITEKTLHAKMQRYKSESTDLGAMLAERAKSSAELLLRSRGMHPDQLKAKELALKPAAAPLAAPLIKDDSSAAAAIATVKSLPVSESQAMPEKPLKAVEADFDRPAASKRRG